MNIIAKRLYALFAMLPALPFAQNMAMAQSGTYENQAVSVVWNFNSATDYAKVSSVSHAEAFSVTSFDLAGCAVTGTGESKNLTGVTFVKIKPANESSVISWNVKPAKGLSFTPTKLSGKINRGATDVKDGVTISAQKEGATPIALATYTAMRYGNATEEKYPTATNIANSFEIVLTAEQQAALTTNGFFSLISKVGVGATKEGFFSDIHIEGIVSGTIESVVKHSVSSALNIPEAGSVAVNPLMSEFEAGDKVTFEAVDNFGYNFVNWTDKDGKELSADSKFVLTVAGPESVTANFVKVDVYELAVTVDGGNDYMVDCSPAPTVVDGKSLYEAGTKVTITANSNKLVQFLSWGNGETQPSRDVVMNADLNEVARFEAGDFLAIWDFYEQGNGSRKADFFDADNELAQLVMRNDDGAIATWLDKSSVKGGFEGRPGAVNWKNDAPIGTYYWQTSVNASNFTSLSVESAMAYNYNAIPTFLVQYSLDGEAWTTLGKIEMKNAKAWTDLKVDLPAEANNKSKVYVRWYPDRSVSVAGSESKNDGVALGAIYITGQPKLMDDGKAPVLLSSVPAPKAANASANGKVVLNFDEKVRVADGAKASLSDGSNVLSLVPVVSGKSVIFEYRGLGYSTAYSFSLPANSVLDLMGNAVDSEIKVLFSTKTKPVVEKKLYDFVVPRDGSLDQAIAAANNRADMSARFRVFVCEGFYTLPASKTETKTVNVELKSGDSKSFSFPNPVTVLSASNVSIVGPGMSEVVIDNECPTQTYEGKYGFANISEGIGNGDVLENRGSNNYFQGITIKRTIGDAKGRDVAYNDKGDKTIFKDACLWGYQDTYVSNNQNGRFYFEGGVLRGRTDYLCGKGDVFYREVTLQQCGTGGYLAVPSVARKYGYVFVDCYIKKETKDVTYYLGRPWGDGTPAAIFINTEVEAAPLSEGWAEMGSGWPARFAEFNTHTTSGTVVDLSNRKKVFDSSHSNNPVLSATEAAEYSVENVMGGADNWDPTALTEQASAPTNVHLDGATLSWDENPYALLYAVCKNGKVVDFTLDTSYTIDDASALYSVRAANEMGGLSIASPVSAGTAIDVTSLDSEVVAVEMFDALGRKVLSPVRGVYVQKTYYSNGHVESHKVLVK